MMTVFLFFNSGYSMEKSDTSDDPNKYAAPFIASYSGVLLEIQRNKNFSAVSNPKTKEGTAQLTPADLIKHAFGFDKLMQSGDLGNEVVQLLQVNALPKELVYKMIDACSQSVMQSSYFKTENLGDENVQTR